MIDALGALGIGIDQLDRNSVRVTPHNLRGPTHIDCGLAGTLMRFLPPLAATADGDIEFDGDEGARRRPMATTIESLRALGVAVSDAGSASLPFTVHGDGVVPGGSVELDASASSQFVSGLLLSAPRFENGITVRHRGESVPSLPHIEMTVAMLQEAGAEVRSDVEDPTNARWTVRPGVINLGDFVVEPDLSNAAAFLGAAMVTAGSVTVPTWPTKTTQAGDQIRDVFAEMGGSCVLDDAGLTVTGPERMVGIDIDLRDIGELTPTIAAVAVFAQTPSKLRGVAHLRGHETNRLAALVTEFNRLGGQAEELADGLTITPRRLSGASIATYHDHLGRDGVGYASLLTSESGTFWFFSPESVELILKVVDACGHPDFQDFWVYASGLTDVDAITLSSLRMFGMDKLTAVQTITAITLATLSNLAFKTGLVVVIGGAALARRVLPGLLAIAAGLVGGLLLI